MVPSSALPAGPKLTDRVAEAIEQHIAGNGLAPGTQLPTIAALSEAYGVSATVVREAMALLRSEGLVEVRQGSGAYVSSALRPFRIAPAAASDAAVLRVLELRLGPEAEAAALAATRAGREEVRRIREAFKALTRRIAQGELAVAEDLGFHRAVAEAAGNPLFVEFQTFLQQYLTNSIGVSQGYSRDAGRMVAVLEEHRRILDAIAAHDPEAARAAMRDHLRAGMTRIRPARPAGP